MEQLLSVMGEFAYNLHETEDIHINDDEASSIVQRLVQTPEVTKILNRVEIEPSSIELAPVHTYVQQIAKDPSLPGQPKVVVPAFASHWGIVVHHTAEKAKLYHLIFARQDEVNSSTVPTDDIQLDVYKLRNPLTNSKQVGLTRFSSIELEHLGEAMIEQFGNYHRVFWNCQTFAKCFLRVITGDFNAKFDNWTTADTSRLFLAAFLVGAPIASTSKLVENKQMEKLVNKITSISNELSPTEQSRLAISAMYEGLQAGGFNDESPVKDETDKPGFIHKLFKRLFK